MFLATNQLKSSTLKCMTASLIRPMLTKISLAILSRLSFLDSFFGLTPAGTFSTSGGGVGRYADCCRCSAAAMNTAAADFSFSSTAFERLADGARMVKVGILASLGVAAAGFSSSPPDLSESLGECRMKFFPALVTCRSLIS